MTPELKYKMERVGVLLAQSPLDAEIKKLVIDNISSLTEKDVDLLLESLQRETIELTTLSKTLSQFDQKQDEDWAELAARQKEVARTAVEEAFKKATA